MKSIYKLVLPLFIATNSFAQFNYYEFDYCTKPYQELENPTNLHNNEVWNNETLTIPIEIDFNFFNREITQLKFEQNPNNFSDWSGSIFNVELLDPTFGIADYRYILPHCLQITDQTFNQTTSISPISYELISTENEEILIIEWKNVGILDTKGAYLNYQVWLYSENHIIEFHYGSSSIPESFWVNNELHSGLFNTTTGCDINYSWYSLGNSASAPILNTYNWTGGSIGSLTSFPEEGQVYRFIPYYSVGIEESLSNTSVYPNPAKDILRIHNNFIIQEITINDISGKEMRRFKIDAKEEILDISDLETGIYLIGIKSENNWSWGKILKH